MAPTSAVILLSRYFRVAIRKHKTSIMEEFFHRFASREFASISWAFLLKYVNMFCIYLLDCCWSP